MKKIHRFLLKEIPSGNSLIIADMEIIHLLSNVLKLNVGEECIVFANGSDDYICKIAEITKKSINLSVVSRNKKISTSNNITACISITKRDNFELVVQKLTELGIQKIVPIVSDRTIKQSIRIDRLQKISNEALEQCGGSTVVQICEPISLKESLEANKDAPQCYFDIEGKPNTELEKRDSVFYIGPEGGWSDADKILFKNHNAKAYKLGNTVLRAETAAIVAAYTLLWR